MPVTVTIERRVIPGAQAEIGKLLRQLRSRAAGQPGFLSGQTVVDAFNPTILMTISIWASLAAWEQWQKNPRRTEVISRINTLVQGKPTERIWRHDEDAPPAAV